MVLNEEQKEVIEISKNMKKGEILKIQSPAGSGKTFILLEIARQNPNSSFLYLAFNRSIIQEISHKTTPNTTIKTTHSLAYQHIVKTHYRGITVRGEYKALEIKQLLKEKRRSYEQLSLVKQIFEDYCHSDEKSIDIQNSAEHQDAFELYQMMKKGVIPITHSFYLKEYQLLPAKEKKLDMYDFILLDEAQDTNRVTLDIFLNSPNKKILVGDEHQSIYGFRGAFNAMSNFRADYEVYLTYCFRTPQEYLNKATFFINTFKKNIKKVAITEYRSYFSEAQESTSAIITRTNAKIFETIANNTCNNVRPFKDPRETFALILNLKSLYDNKKHEIVSPHLQYLKKFYSLEDVEQYASTTKDSELIFSIHLVQKYNDSIPAIYKKAIQLYQSPQKIQLLNAHTAKGLEFDKVTLTDDFSDIQQQNKEMPKQASLMDIQKFYEEINLYYVAITRTKQILIDKTFNDVFYRESLENHCLLKTKSKKS